jgi:hypothetical protein
MMQQIKNPDRIFKTLVSSAFPEYRGRRFFFDVVSPDQEMHLDSYWSDGYRDYHVFINLETGNHMQLPQNGTPYDGPLSRGITHTIPDGFALVTRCYCGTKQYIKVTVNSNNTAKLIAA